MVRIPGTGRGYAGGHAGAPPVPPPGGYRGERRFPEHPVAGHFLAQAPPPRSGPRLHPVGWIALLAAGLFSALLIALATVGEAHSALGTSMLVLQVVVVGLVIAALCIRRARLAAAIALTVSLLVNVGTVGAVGALLSDPLTPPSAGTTADGPADGDYAGIKDVDPQSVLLAPSLEDVQDHTNELSERIRESLSAEFGLTWTRIADASARPERNGYGGESMLQQYTSPTWRTDQPIRDHDQKLEVMAAIDRELAVAGEYYALYPLNEPDGSIDPRALESLYGSADPREQSVWEYVAQRYGTPGISSPSPTLLYATLTDLSNDDDGQVRAREEAERTDGEPLEGLNLMFISAQLLAEGDRDAFADATR